MTVGVPELQDLADRVVAQAAPGEQVEAFIQKGTYGWTLYGLRLPVQSAQPEAATVPAEDEIPY